MLPGFVLTPRATQSKRPIPLHSVANQRHCRRVALFFVYVARSVFLVSRASHELQDLQDAVRRGMQSPRAILFGEQLMQGDAGGTASEMRRGSHAAPADI